MRLLSIFVAISLLSMALPTYAAYPSPLEASPSTTSPAGRYQSPVPGEFPIIASTVFNKDTGPQPEDLEGIEQCGFNVCMDNSTPERFEKLLGYMKDTNLKLLIQSEPFMVYENSKSTAWTKTLPELVKRFGDNPLVAGWKFCDEPRWNARNEILRRFDLLEKSDPGSFIYINLVGQIAKDFTGPCRNLPQYLDSIQNTFRMDVWSFDYYPIMVRQGKLIVNYRNFYLALDAFSRKAKQTGIPMWSYLESLEYIMKSYSCPPATQPYLSFAAFSSLAYGAQGLLYYTYWQRPSTPTVEQRAALVDMQGNRMPAWYAAQKVNFQIKALTPVVLGAEMMEVRHSGVIDMDGTLPFISDFGPLAELSNGVKGVLVSHLRNNGHDYLMIVNHDVANSQKIKLRFKDNLSITRLIPSDKGILSAEKVKAKLNINLSPGGYAVFEWR